MQKSDGNSEVVKVKAQIAMWQKSAKQYEKRCSELEKELQDLQEQKSTDKETKPENSVRKLILILNLFSSNDYKYKLQTVQ